MGYGDNRYGSDDRWRDREFGGRDYRNRERGYRRGYRDEDEDRGFFDRAGDEVRSWFGDDEAERRREADRRAYEREQDYESRGRRYREGPRERMWRGNEEPYSASGEVRGGSGFGGDYDRGRRFDRIDVGSTGTHGVHPMSAPAGAEPWATFGPGERGSYARDYAAYEAERRARAASDPHYHEWRNRQIDALDRDYDDYRREHQTQFEQEFGSWREKRRDQREALRRVEEHMEVVGSDGTHLGTVDKTRGDRIILTKSDPSAGGHHHSIPCGWIDKVEDRVMLNRTADQARRAWTDEETSRALFEREENMSTGPHALDRSFSGTY